MSITDELREWFKDRFFMANGWQEIHDIADRIDAEHEAKLTMARGEAVQHLGSEVANKYVKLPVDADGVPIRVGDVMDKGKVTCIRDCGKGWEVILNSLSMYDAPSLHHHAPTVEDVLREFAQEMNENLGMYTGEAIDADEWHDADAKTIAEFAAKLRLAGDAE